MDDDAGGVCGVNGWAEGGDVVRTSTHDKNEYSISAKSSGILSGGEPPSHSEGNHEEDGHYARLLRGKTDAVLVGIQRRLQDDHESHSGHGSGGGVEHPIHGVDNVLFAADSSSGIASHYSVKAFSKDFDSFVMRSGSFDLMTSAEIGTSQHVCKRATKNEFDTAVSSAFDTAKVTAGTRDQLNISNHGCLVPPCATEEDLCKTDPSCSVSPYQERETMKPGAMVGFFILGAAVWEACLLYYDKRIKRQIGGENGTELR